MTQGATPRQAHTALSSVESDLLYEVVDGQIVEKEAIGAYEILVGSFLNTCLDGFARANNCGRAVSEMLFDFGAGTWTAAAVQLLPPHNSPTLLRSLRRHY